jgi:ribosomal-protein-alanine N-acetyltransferase
MPRSEKRAETGAFAPATSRAGGVADADKIADAGVATIRIRPFRIDDTEAAMAIAAESPEAATWSRVAYEELLKQPHAVALVIEAAANGQFRLGGFLVAQAAGAEAEVLNLAVARENRRRGHATTLLRAALTELLSRGAHCVYLEVRQSNTGAIAFYKKHGFAEIGLRKGYYHGPDEPAVTMRKQFE